MILLDFVQKVVYLEMLQSKALNNAVLATILAQHALMLMILLHVLNAFLAYILMTITLLALSVH